MLDLPKICYTVSRITMSSPDFPMPTALSTVTLLVCTKGKCAKNRSEKTCQRLRELVDERGLDDVIEVKKCGCLGYCKDGPNVMIEETGKVLTDIAPKKAGRVIEKILSKMG